MLAASSIIESVRDTSEPKIPPSRGIGATPGTTPRSAGGAPLVLVPVTAEDVARRGRRTKLTWAVILLVIGAVSGWIYKRYNDPIKAQQSRDAAQRLFDQARYEQAIVSCDRAVALKPDLTEAYLLRGRSRVARYETELAIEDFTQALQWRPSDTPALLERASAYVYQKKYTEAITDASAALAIDPKLARAYNLRATAVRATGDARKAVADFTQALELEPGSDNFFQRGATYQLLSDHRHAVEDFTQAIALDPDKPQTYFARAESERALGQTAEAERDHLQGRTLDGR